MNQTPFWLYAVGDVAADQEGSAFLHADATVVGSQNDVTSPFGGGIHSGLEPATAGGGRPV